MEGRLRLSCPFPAGTSRRLTGSWLRLMLGCASLTTTTSAPWSCPSEDTRRQVSSVRPCLGLALLCPGVSEDAPVSAVAGLGGLSAVSRGGYLTGG